MFCCLFTTIFRVLYDAIKKLRCVILCNKRIKIKVQFDRFHSLPTSLSRVLSLTFKVQGHQISEQWPNYSFIFTQTFHRVLFCIKIRELIVKTLASHNIDITAAIKSSINSQSLYLFKVMKKPIKGQLQVLMIACNAHTTEKT